MAIVTKIQGLFSRHFVLFATFFMLALLVRIPRLYESPGFFEANELKVTLNLIRGDYFPLFNQNPHIGAFSNYLIAAFFKLLGMHWWVPRAVAITLGALTIPLTYFLGRRLSDGRTSLLAAILLAFSMYHVVVLSHIPWSNNMSPFFAALCTLCLLRATKDFNLFWLGATGFFFGITLQTHPSLITYLLPIVLIYLFSRRIPLRTRLWSISPIVFVASSAVGYANMIYFNIANSLESVSFAMSYPTYAVEKNPEAGTYFKNLGEEIFLLLRLLSGAAETKSILPFNWLSFVLLFAGILLVAGLIECLRKKQWQLPVLLILPLLTIPIFNKAYELCQFGRYLGFLIIPGYLVMAEALVRWFDLIRQKTLYISYSIILFPVILVATHLNQLHKLSIELEFKHSSVIVFREAAAALKEQIPKNTPLLVDRTAMHASGLMLFLQSDGWEVESLNSSFWKTKKENLSESEARSLIQHQITKAEMKTGTALLISSPNFLKVVFEEKPLAKCVSCLSVQALEVKDELKPLYFFMDLSKDPTHVVRSSLLVDLKPFKGGRNIQQAKLYADKAVSLWSKSCQKVFLKHTSASPEICIPDRHSKKVIRARQRHSRR